MLNSNICFYGKSAWYILRTSESYNGLLQLEGGHSNYDQWFASNAFGGTNYSNTPVGAVCSADAPGSFSFELTFDYFPLWAAGRRFGICAWQVDAGSLANLVIGDPLMKR